MAPITLRRTRSRGALIGTAVALVAGSVLAAPLAATAAPTYEVESTIPIEPGVLRPNQALYNPVNESTYFVNRSANYVIVVGSDGAVTNLTISSPYAQTVDADGNVWVGGSGAAAGRNLTRIAPDLTMTGIVMPEVRDVAANTATGGVAVITDGQPGRISVVAADQSVTWWNVGGNVRNSGIAVNPTTGNIYVTGNRDEAGVTETGTWIYEPTGAQLDMIPTTDDRAGEPVYNPATGRIYVPTSASGVTVINPDFTSEVVAVPTSSNATVAVLSDGRVAVLPGAGDLAVSFINTDNTFTSTPASFAIGATMDARGTVFISTGNDGLLVVHSDGSTESLASSIDPGAVLYNTATDRVIAADLNLGNVYVIKAAAPLIAPITILTPADGSILEPGFTMTGTGEADSFFLITDGSGGAGSRVNIESDGTWSTGTATYLTPGDYVWTLTQDADGSTAVLHFTIAVAPVITPVSITAPADGSSVGVRPTLTGGGTPGAVVTITDGSTVLGTAPVEPGGTWTFTPSADLAAGVHSFTATQDVDSSTATVSVTVTATVIPDPGNTVKPSDGKLSSTGADAVPALLIGGLLAGAGIIATILGTRKRRLTE